MSAVNDSRSRVAPGVRPIVVSAGHASSTYFRRLASALGAGSVATTSKPRARYCAAQLAPMTPVPTMAMRRMGLSYFMSCVLRREVGVGDAGKIALREEQNRGLQAVEARDVDRAGEIGHEHALARAIEGDADAFHEIPEHDLRRGPAVAPPVERRAAHGVAERRVAAIGPVEDPSCVIDLEVDRLGQAVVQHLDVA